MVMWECSAWTPRSYVVDLKADRVVGALPGLDGEGPAGPAGTGVLPRVGRQFAGDEGHVRRAGMPAEVRAEESADLPDLVGVSAEDAPVDAGAWFFRKRRGCHGMSRLCLRSSQGSSR
ncbi:hypothetical protein GCM10023196_102850 [Actinoallomurus vinaceus]|uniref:Uncharacterized protein n=1 Tax=Actinoallomurus vinaceus TaxID=1080074 RepID=A0ABP8UUC6_9ACTN